MGKQPRVIRPRDIVIRSSAEKSELVTVEPAASAPVTGQHYPVIIAELSRKGKKRFTTFFTDNIRNPNTRQAYFRASFQFFHWCDQHELGFTDIQSFHVAAYIEHLLEERSKSTAKQHLAAIRMLYDWLIVGQIVEINPAQAVRGPKHVVTQGTTPILDADQMAQLIEAIDVSSAVGLRDRALIATMTATFGRIEATLGMNVTDYFDEGKNWSIKLHEKNGKTIIMPVQHKLEEYLDAYITAAEHCRELQQTRHAKLSEAIAGVHFTYACEQHRDVGKMNVNLRHRYEELIERASLAELNQAVKELLRVQILTKDDFSLFRYHTPIRQAFLECTG